MPLGSPLFLSGGLIVRLRFPVERSHSTAPPWLAVARYRLSAEKSISYVVPPVAKAWTRVRLARSNTIARPSSPADATNRPSGEQATSRSHFEFASIVATQRPVAKFQTSSRPESNARDVPAITYFPSGVIATPPNSRSFSSGDRNSRSWRPVFASQIRTAPSSPQLTMRVPSGV